jgi:hypothetical protein
MTAVSVPYARICLYRVIITCAGCSNVASFGEVLADAKNHGHVLIKGRLEKLLEEYLEQDGDST